MPFSGEICSELGAYKSVCCGTEVVVAAGTKFPICPNHTEWPAEWRMLPDWRPKKKTASAKKK